MVTELIIENIGTTKEVNETIDDVTGMNLVKDDMDTYERYKKAKSVSNSVCQPGSVTLNVTGNLVDGKEVASTSSDVE